MIGIEKLKQAALISNGEPMLISASKVLELITRLEAAESQLVAQELVIQQLRDALIFWDDCDKALTIPTSTEHLEAWYKGMVGEAVGYCLGAEHFSYIKCWPTGRTQLHAIKPFPFKGE